MKDIAIFMGVFAVGYLLTMGLLYVVLSVFPKRRDRSIHGVITISGNSRNEAAGVKSSEKSGKMRFANG